MPSVELSAGTIEYSGTGGDGPPFVLLHGLAMDGALWREVVARLDGGPRCVMPTLPFGAHRVPMRRDADLSLRGIGRIAAELLDALHLHDPALADDRTAAPAPVHVREHVQPRRARSADEPVAGADGEDKLMPREHGPRLAASFPHGRLVEIDDSYTLVPIDQPAALAEQLRAFAAA